MDALLHWYSILLLLVVSWIATQLSPRVRAHSPACSDLRIDFINQVVRAFLLSPIVYR